MRSMRRRGTGLAVVLAVVLVLLAGRTEGGTATIVPLNEAADLDLSGTVVYAVNFGDDGSPVVGGIDFSQDEALGDVALYAEGEGPATAWGDYPATGDDALDKLLNGMAYSLEQSPNVIQINMSGLTAGKRYLFQLIAYEPTGDPREIDMVVENETVLTGINPVDLLGGVIGQGGLIIEYEFIAGDSVLNVRVVSEDACAVSAALLQAITVLGATAPDPEDGATDVFADGLLGWKPGEFAAGHDVYLGTSSTDVEAASRDNPMGLLVSENQDADTYDPPGRLDWEQTYYWRVDEVNGAPDDTIHGGEVWSFTVEPFAYPVENITASSNGTSGADEGPENTVNGSGLNADDQHSIEASDMWLAMSGAEPVYIQYEFDRLYKLHAMLVWNYNGEFEQILGVGPKDVAVTYSENGLDWLSLGNVQFARASSAADYTANTVVDLGGVAAQYVRLTVSSCWGTVGQVGLSEVRFTYVPIQATRPVPAAGAADVSERTALSWRAGREAAGHEIYLGTAPDTLMLVETGSDGLCTPSDLELGSTYYWRVDEVNEAAARSPWPGTLWSFTTREFIAVDDFESYDDRDNAVFDTWVDGWTNGTGSVVGYAQAPFAEQTIVHSGGQSMPLEYDNSIAPYYSEAQRDLAGADWTARGADTLRLLIRGDSDNEPAILYVVVEDTSGRSASVAHADTQIALSTAWEAWLIPFAQFEGVDLSSVKTVFIGLGERENPGAGGSGLIYIDDIEVGHPASTE